MRNDQKRMKKTVHTSTHIHVCVHTQQQLEDVRWRMFMRMHTCTFTCMGLYTTYIFSSVQSLSRVRLCNPVNRSTPGLPVHHQLPEFTQTHIHRVSDAIQPSYPRLSPSPPAPIPHSIRVFSNEAFGKYYKTMCLHMYLYVCVCVFQHIQRESARITSPRLMRE